MPGVAEDAWECEFNMNIKRVSCEVYIDLLSKKEKWVKNFEKKTKECNWLKLGES